LKKIVVQASKLNGSAGSNADAMPDHQVRQTGAIKKDDTLRKVPHEVARLAR
jgi:hypothetical protein